MAKIRYKLTLEVDDVGLKTFTSEGFAFDEIDLIKRIPFQVSRALNATMLSPPRSLAMAAALESNRFSVVSALALVDANRQSGIPFEQCVNVTVDLNNLTQDNEAISFIKSVLSKSGIETNK